MNLSSVIGISLVLALVPAAIVPTAAAHYCVTIDNVGVTYPPLNLLLTGDCGDCAPQGTFHLHIEILTLGPDVQQCESAGTNTCPDEPVHRYGSGSSVGGRSATVTGDDDVGLGFVTVTDTNAADCDGDGIGGDWDGDYDVGFGGGAFGWGPWADEPICNNGLNVHGSSVVVNDAVFGGDITFVIGEDDQSGPVIVPVDEDGDGVPEGHVCETSGSITPGDPATDPTADPDDCLSEQYLTTGPTCGSGGGDGLFWVFLDGFFVDETGGSPSTNNPPTAGTITAF